MKSITLYVSRKIEAKLVLCMKALRQMYSVGTQAIADDSSQAIADDDSH